MLEDIWSHESGKDGQHGHYDQDLDEGKSLSGLVPEIVTAKTNVG
jgi:hypothetical protein